VRLVCFDDLRIQQSQQYSSLRAGRQPAWLETTALTVVRAQFEAASRCSRPPRPHPEYELFGPRKSKHAAHAGMSGLCVAVISCPHILFFECRLERIEHAVW
jgi:hypothetical protein